MTFRRGQIVEITRIDEGDNPGWIGFRGEVADLITANPALAVVEGDHYTKLLPLSDRPDVREDPRYTVSPRAWFFWPTDDLRVVSEGAEDKDKVG